MLVTVVGAGAAAVIKTYLIHVRNVLPSPTKGHKEH